MNANATMVWVILLSFFCVIAATASNTPRNRTITKQTSPYTLFFDPEENSVRLEKQRVDYDLTQGTELRVGPYIFRDEQVRMQMSRESQMTTDLELGFEKVKIQGQVYLLSFRWPTDYLQEGLLEIIDDRAQSLWRKPIGKAELESWQKSTSNEKSASVSRVHVGSQFGLAHKSFFEIPIAQITMPFRFCLSQEKYTSRVALCSQRYVFAREGGVYTLRLQSKNVAPRVMINDKDVSLRGSAIFIDNKIPIKFSALLAGGTYFEFVSHPKDIRLVDMIRNHETGKNEIIGYGDMPLGEVAESFIADTVNWGFLNFAPTIGDLRKFWRTEIPQDSKFIYIKGEGGVPFRQNFTYTSLPTTKARIELDESSTKSTYKSSVKVAGRVHPEIQVDADAADVKRISATEFIWDFPTPEPGLYNKSLLNVHEDNRKWRAGYEIYRGFPAEIGLRLTGIVTDNFTLVLMAEAGGQYWFEDLFGWENHTFSKQRWGVSAKYFEAVKGTKRSLSKLAAGNVDIKYRLTPGVWGRDPTVGLIASGLNLDYGFKDDLGRVRFAVPVVGGGIFWARSMPQIFDDLFNLLPFMRYPKWVDWEVVVYPVALREKQRSNYMFTMNFHGKVQWTQYIYGEGGFGLKNLSFSDHRSGDPDKQLDPNLGILYGQFGIGINF